MKFTRRTATVGGLGLLASSSLSTSSLADMGGELLGIGERLEDFWLATDAYIYGYPLVTMEMTRRVITNVARPEGTKAPMGQLIKLRAIPERFVPRCDRAERRHVLYHGLLRRRQGAVGRGPPRHEGSISLDADAGWLDLRVPSARQEDHRHRGADLRHHRARLDRHASGGNEGVQITNQHGVAAWTHLLHGHTRGLCGGARFQDEGQAGTS